MPTYTFKHKETQEVSEVVMKMSELDAYKAEHPELELVVSGGATVFDPLRLGMGRKGTTVPDGFREVLRNIANNTPGGKGLLDKIR